MASNKSKILNAASELLLQKGPGGLSVRSIAARVGVSTIGIYSHFQGKQGILEALYIQGFERLHDSMQSASAIEGPKGAVMQATKNYLVMAHAHEAEYRLIFGETNADYEPGNEAKEARLRAFARLLELAARLLPVDASLETKQHAALRIWAAVHGFVSLQHHVIKDIIPSENWAKQTLSAVECLVDDILDNGLEGLKN